MHAEVCVFEPVGLGAEHHQPVDQAVPRVLERSRQTTHRFEAEALPEADGALIGRHEVRVSRSMPP